MCQRAGGTVNCRKLARRQEFERSRDIALSGDKRMGRAEVPAELPGRRQCDRSSSPWRLDTDEEGTAPRRRALTVMHDGERADLS